MAAKKPMVSLSCAGKLGPVLTVLDEWLLPALLRPLLAACPPSSYYPAGVKLAETSRMRVLLGQSCLLWQYHLSIILC